MDVIFYMIIAIVFYFIPSFVGYNKRNAEAIMVLNFFLGWTVLGWIIALVWASTTDTPTTKVVTKTESVTSELERLADLRQKGVLNDQEFETAKRKLLDK